MHQGNERESATLTRGRAVAVHQLQYEASILPPPYRDERPLAPGASHVPRGTLLILSLERLGVNGTERGQLLQTVMGYRRDLAVAVLLRLPGSELAVHPNQLAHLLGGGCRAIVPDGRRLDRLIWEILPRVSDLGGAWVEWLRLHREVSGAAAAIIHTIADGALEHGGVTLLLRDAGIPPRSARAVLRQERLPPPGRFYTAVRVVRGHLWLQQDRERQVQRVAWRLGYADPSGFVAASRRLFDVSPSEARRLLGLEWRLAEWWKRGSTDLAHGRASSPELS